MLNNTVISLAVILLFFATITPTFASPFQDGLELVQRNQLDAAAKMFTQAIEQGNRPAAAYSNRCLVHLKREDYSAAIADCSQALHQPLSQPSISFEAYLNRGLANYRLEHYTDAIADYDRLLTLNRQDFRGYYNRGLSKVALRQLSSAIEDFSQAERFSRPESPTMRAEIFNDWGLALFLDQQWPSAYSKFERAIRLAPQSDGYYFNRGCTCHKMENYVCALTDFTRVVGLNPQFIDAYVSRGTTHALSGELRKAIEDWNTAANLFAKDGNLSAQKKIQHLVERAAASTELLA